MAHGAIKVKEIENDLDKVIGYLREASEENGDMKCFKLRKSFIRDGHFRGKYVDCAVVVARIGYSKGRNPHEEKFLRQKAEDKALAFRDDLKDECCIDGFQKNSRRIGRRVQSEVDEFVVYMDIELVRFCNTYT